MHLTVFKNTALLCVLIGISCGNSAKTDDRSPLIDEGRRMTEDSLPLSNGTEVGAVVVGANRTELYVPMLKGERVGIVANKTSVIFKDGRSKKGDQNNEKIATTISKSRNDNYTHLVDSLLALDIEIKKVFTPEHGFRGTADAGEIVKDDRDTKTGLPLISLYGDNKKPTPKQLEHLDVMVFDIQDVGVRFYTYISTLHLVMEACAEAKIPVVVLDRPNPNGHYVDGPTLEPEHKSFLGMHAIPLVHGMTIGEYAQMINGESWLKNGLQCELVVITIENYSHQTTYSLPIRPSPNLPNDQAIALYPSLGLFEGTNINAGRGTEFQFQRYGAPFLDKNVFTFTYTPIENFGAKSPKHKDKLCYGEDLQFEKANQTVSLKWLIKAYRNATDKSLVFNTANFTKHAGTAKLQKQIEAGLSEEAIKATWKADLDRFREIRKKYLLYD